MIKKMMLSLTALLFVAVLTGCTAIDTTSKFNTMPVNDTRYPAVAHVNVRITGFYLFHCLPIVCGSASGAGKIAMFKDTVTVDNAMMLMTENARGKGGTRIHDVVSDVSSLGFILFSIDRVQVSGTTSSDTKPLR